MFDDDYKKLIGNLSVAHPAQKFPADITNTHFNAVNEEVALFRNQSDKLGEFGKTSSFAADDFAKARGTIDKIGIPNHNYANDMLYESLVKKEPLLNTNDLFSTKLAKQLVDSGNTSVAKKLSVFEKDSLPEFFRQINKISSVFQQIEIIQKKLSHPFAIDKIHPFNEPSALMASIRESSNYLQAAKDSLPKSLRQINEISSIFQQIEMVKKELSHPFAIDKIPPFNELSALVASVRENSNYLKTAKANDLFVLERNAISDGFNSHVAAIGTINTALLKITPKEIVCLGFNALQEYYSEINKGFQKNDEAKLILVGNGRVGKTSISKWLAGKKFNPNEPITHGIRRGKFKRNNINLTMWDFGGQDIYHATHRLFLTQGAIYLVVWDGLTEYDSDGYPLAYWLETIRNLGGNSPIIIVKNERSDSNKSEPVVIGAYCEEYDLDIYKNTCSVNAETGKGFPHLRELIKAQYETLTDVTDKEIPNSWIAVREELECLCHDGKNTLTYNDYLEICEREDITEENAHVLCQFLHQLSVVLYFDNSQFSQSNNLLILNPIWASKLIYGVLDPETSFLKQRMGKFNKKDLFEHFHASKASKKKTLSENEIDNLLKLMLNFELCFKVFGASDEYIAPQFLSEEKEKCYLTLWHYKGSAHLRYRYRKFIPKNTMIRMLSRFGNKIEEMYYWKNGLVWNGQDADALIEAFPQNKYIDVSVQGSNKRLLTDIYQAFHEINGNCPVEIEIPCPCSKCATSTQPYAFGIALVQERHQKSQDIQCQASGEQVKTNDLIGWLNFKETQTVNNQKPLKLFYSYSHKDEELRNELEKHLKPLKRQNLLEGWHDRKIEAGKVWENTLLDENLATADIILFLLSVDFLASDYCYNIEVTQAMKQHEEGISVVIPIMLRPCDLTGAPFMKLQGLPKDLVPVTEWDSLDKAFCHIAKELRVTVEEIWKKRNNH